MKDTEFKLEIYFNCATFYSEHGTDSMTFDFDSFDEVYDFIELSLQKDFPSDKFSHNLFTNIDEYIKFQEEKYCGTPLIHFNIRSSKENHKQHKFYYDITPNYLPLAKWYEKGERNFLIEPEIEFKFKSNDGDEFIF